MRARIDGAVVDLGDEIELDRTQDPRSRRRRRSHRRSRRASRAASPTASSSRSSSARAACSSQTGGRRAVLDERALRLRRLRHLAAADRAAHVLVQRPARRVPGVRRPRRARRGRSRARRAAIRAARCAKAWCSRGAAAGSSRSRPRSRARSRRSASTPTCPGRSCPKTQRQAILFGPEVSQRAQERARKKGRTRKRESGKKQGLRGHRPAARATPRVSAGPARRVAGRRGP